LANYKKRYLIGALFFIEIIIYDKISMFAVIKTGGKQYKVTQGEKLAVEKLENKVGGKVIFDQILLWSDEKEVKIGNPLLSGVTVEAKVLEQFRDDKVTVIKHKAKKRYKKKYGHRQPLTEIEVTKIAVK